MILAPHSDRSVSLLETEREHRIVRRHWWVLTSYLPTGLRRAKRLAVLVGPSKAIGLAVR